MGDQATRAGAGAVLAADRDDGVDVYVDAVRAGDAHEVGIVEDGEYTSVYRVDGALLELLDDDGYIVVDLSGEVDEAGLRSLIRDYLQRHPIAPVTASPLDFAEAWLRADWEFERSRRPRWLHRRVNPASPPAREELVAPPGAPVPRLVRPWLLREVVDEVLARLPEGAVRVEEGVGVTARRSTCCPVRPEPWTSSSCTA